MLELGPPLSATLAPLVPATGGGVRRAIDRFARTGLRGVQLSAALKGVRPRELSRRARRDVLAALARRGLTLSGLDLMIPHKDWLAPATQERAADAALAAIGLASDFGRVPLSMTLPVERLDEDVASTLLTAADASGVVLAIHAEHDAAALAEWLDEHEIRQLGAGLDPAALLAAGHDPSAWTARLSPHLRVARLDDHTPPSVASAGGRCPLGRGDLDVLAYRAALSTCPGLRAVVIELRDLPDPLAALSRAVDTWGE